MSWRAAARDRGRAADRAVALRPQHARPSATLKQLETWRVSVIAMNGLAFDLTTRHGRMLATIIARIAEFERELVQERVRSGLARQKARGKRGSGQNPRSWARVAAIASSTGNWG
jgi:DNA invertase Pin-like site-specific DNA recombinase